MIYDSDLVKLDTQEFRLWQHIRLRIIDLCHRHIFSESIKIKLSEIDEAIKKCIDPKYQISFFDLIELNQDLLDELENDRIHTVFNDLIDHFTRVMTITSAFPTLANDDLTRSESQNQEDTIMNIELANPEYYSYFESFVRTLSIARDKHNKLKVDHDTFNVMFRLKYATSMISNYLKSFISENSISDPSLLSCTPIEFEKLLNLIRDIETISLIKSDLAQFQRLMTEHIISTN